MGPNSYRPHVQESQPRVWYAEPNADYLPATAAIELAKRLFVQVDTRIIELTVTLPLENIGMWKMTPEEKAEAMKIREIVKRPSRASANAVPSGCKLIIVGESPPPIQSNVERTSMRRLCHLAGDPRFLDRKQYVLLRNVNAACPGTYRRGSKQPNRHEATSTALRLLQLNDNGQWPWIRDLASIVYILLGNSVSMAFRLYGEKSPNRFPNYQLYRVADHFVGEEKKIYRFVVRFPHPSKVNTANPIDEVRASEILRTLCRRANESYLHARDPDE